MKYDAAPRIYTAPTTLRQLRALAATHGMPFRESDASMVCFPKRKDVRDKAMLNFLGKCARAHAREAVEAAREERAKVRAKKQRPVGSWVYFVRGGDAIKIGMARDVAARIRELQVGCPHRIELLHAIPGARQYERSLHLKYRRTRLVGEWFRADDALLRHIERLKARAAR